MKDTPSLQEALAQQRAVGSQKATELLPNASVKSENLKRKAHLTAAFSRICVLQHQYGKTKEELEVLVEGFMWLLPDVPTQDILFALKEYTRTHRDIPAPSDVLKILDDRKKLAAAEAFVQTLHQEPNP